MTANGRTIVAFLLGAAVVLVGQALFRADDIVRARFAEPVCAPASACATARAHCSAAFVTPTRHAASPRAARFPIVIDGTAR